MPQSLASQVSLGRERSKGELELGYLADPGQLVLQVLDGVVFGIQNVLGEKGTVSLTVLG